jgi:Putative metal-binding motif
MGRLIAMVVLVTAACGPTISNNNDGGADSCNPGDTQTCYDGPPGTAGVGTCTQGTQTCGSDHQWGTCDNEVIPTGEVCGNGVDENCNGMVDEDVDADGDGFTTCGGDCCDSANDGCGDPSKVNPGAFEAPGNGVDDDCDGMVDNAIAANCDSGLASNSSNGLDYAAAMELCQTTTMADSKWGVISATFSKADGTGAPNAIQRSIRPAFGSTTVQGGSSFAVLSTGAAAAPNQTNPSYAPFQNAPSTTTFPSGGSIGATSGFPADWLALNNGNLPNAPNCPDPADTTSAHDPVMLTLKIRVPTNAKSFKLSTNFLSSEFPEWTCSAYNDFFVVLLDSTFNGMPANPTDKNLATYTSATNMVYPVGVNLAKGDTGLFTVCQNGPIGCANGATAGTISTCAMAAELAGTGMDLTNPAPQFTNDVGYCGANNQVGGGTGWLVTSGNVVGGEIITLRIAVWDTSDSFYDSVAILDNFTWSIEAAQPGTVIF